VSEAAGVLRVEALCRYDHRRDARSKDFDTELSLVSTLPGPWLAFKARVETLGAGAASYVHGLPIDWKVCRDPKRGSESDNDKRSHSRVTSVPSSSSRRPSWPGEASNNETCGFGMRAKSLGGRSVEGTVFLRLAASRRKRRSRLSLKSLRQSSNCCPPCPLAHGCS
jgi:hypothetical protein